MQAQKVFIFLMETESEEEGRNVYISWFYSLRKYHLAYLKYWKKTNPKHPP